LLELSPKQRVASRSPEEYRIGLGIAARA